MDDAGGGGAIIVDSRNRQRGGGAVVAERLRQATNRLGIDCTWVTASGGQSTSRGGSPLRPLPRRVTTDARGVISLTETCNPGPLNCPRVVLVRNLKNFSSSDRIRDVVRARASINWIKTADAIVVASDLMARAVTEVVSSANVHVIRFPIASEFCPVGPRIAGRYILSVGTVARHKRYDVLIKALAQVQQSVDLELWIAGALDDRGLYRELHELAEREGIGSRVRFLGNVPHSDLPSLYRGSAGVVQPSQLESYGHPYFEAAACGARVIAPRTAIVEELEDQLGIEVYEADGSSLACLIEDLASSSQVSGNAASVDGSPIERRQDVDAWFSYARKLEGLLG